MRLNRLVAGPALPGCGKTQIPPGLGKGTSSTRAVTAAESIAASSRWGNAESRKHFLRSLLTLCPKARVVTWLCPVKAHRFSFVCLRVLCGKGLPKLSHQREQNLLTPPAKIDS